MHKGSPTNRRAPPPSVVQSITGVQRTADAQRHLDHSEVVDFLSSQAFSSRHAVRWNPQQGSGHGWPAVAVVSCKGISLKRTALGVFYHVKTAFHAIIKQILQIPLQNRVPGCVGQCGCSVVPQVPIEATMVCVALVPVRRHCKGRGRVTIWLTFSFLSF